MPQASSIQVLTAPLAANGSATSARRSSEDVDSASVDFGAVLAEQLGIQTKASLSEIPVVDDAPETRPEEAAAVDTGAAAALSSIASPALLPAVGGAAGGVVRASGASTDVPRAAAAIEPASHANSVLADSTFQSPAVEIAEPLKLMSATFAANEETAGVADRWMPEVNGGSSRPDAQGVPSQPALPLPQPHTAPMSVQTNPLDSPIVFQRHSLPDELGGRVTWMVAHGQQQAELRLDPPNLGPVEVRLSMSGDQATLSLMASHPGVRDALQASVPRLHEMMQAVGVNLEQVHVGSGSMQQHGGWSQGQRSGSSSAGHDQGESPPLQLHSMVGTKTIGRGLVDVFA